MLRAGSFRVVLLYLSKSRAVPLRVEGRESRDSPNRAPCVSESQAGSLRVARRVSPSRAPCVSESCAGSLRAPPANPGDLKRRLRRPAFRAASPGDSPRNPDDSPRNLDDSPPSTSPSRRPRASRPMRGETYPMVEGGAKPKPGKAPRPPQDPPPHAHWRHGFRSQRK